jgi:hypothetical protein
MDVTQMLEEVMKEDNLACDHISFSDPAADVKDDAHMLKMQLQFSWM